MSILSAAILISSSLGLGMAGVAFAQQNNNTAAMTSLGNNTAATTTTITSSSSNVSKMMGVIASIQQDDKGRPAWITAGQWWLESDMPLITGNTSNTTTTAQPHVTNFTAILYMVSNENGTAFHTHKISNFTQTSVAHQGVNSTTVNGTFTITLKEGPVNNVRGYIHIINDKIEFWVDPMATHNHFGPTTITGIVLHPEKIAQRASTIMAK